MSTHHARRADPVTALEATERLIDALDAFYAAPGPKFERMRYATLSRLRKVRRDLIVVAYELRRKST